MNSVSSNGVTPHPVIETGLTTQQKVEKIAYHMAEILKILGLDLQDDSIRETPLRIAKMYVKELFRGLEDENLPKLTAVANKMRYEQMVLIRSIRVMSMCEHHLMPIHGIATVAYIPDQKVIGLSKINRLVDFFCRRPQIQERLTKQIADSLQNILQTPHVAVHIEARHYCMIARGVQDEQAITVTTDLRGDFRLVAQTRMEFLQAVSRLR